MPLNYRRIAARAALAAAALFTIISCLLSPPLIFILVALFAICLVTEGTSAHYDRAHYHDDAPDDRTPPSPPRWGSCA